MVVLEILLKLYVVIEYKNGKFSCDVMCLVYNYLSFCVYILVVVEYKGKFYGFL